MPRKKSNTTVLRTSVPQATADRINRLARVAGLTPTDLLRYFISVQLVRHERQFGLPVPEDADLIADAVRASGGGDSWGQQQREPEPEPEPERVGFRPRGELDEPSSFDLLADALAFH